MSTITYKILDNGRGSAREKVFKHKHEKETDLENDCNSYVSSSGENLCNFDEVNNMFEIDNGKIIGSPFFSILYSDMSLISVSNNFIIFNKLYLPKLTKNNKNTLALRHTKKNLKIQFDTKMDTLNCFEVLKKRNEYFRMIHY